MWKTVPVPNANVRGTSRANALHYSLINRLRYATEWSPERGYSQLSRSLSSTMDYIAPMACHEKIGPG